MIELEVRRAMRSDLSDIVGLLIDDDLGTTREDLGPPLPQGYIDAFDAMERDPNQILAVALVNGEIVGTLQLTYIPGISHTGSWRGQIEAVRIARPMRSQGLGRQFIQWAVDQATDRGCRIVQLTSNKTRAEAHKFYGDLGFVASHEGFKLTLKK
ncbi:MAG: GNAT family N-acetyltransferase [Pseudomonadota bacterium]